MGFRAVLYGEVGPFSGDEEVAKEERVNLFDGNKHIKVLWHPGTKFPNSIVESFVEAGMIWGSFIAHWECGGIDIMKVREGELSVFKQGADFIKSLAGVATEGRYHGYSCEYCDGDYREAYHEYHQTCENHVVTNWGRFEKSGGTTKKVERVGDNDEIWLTGVKWVQRGTCKVCRTEQLNVVTENVFKRVGSVPAYKEEAEEWPNDNDPED